MPNAQKSVFKKWNTFFFAEVRYDIPNSMQKIYLDSKHFKISMEVCIFILFQDCKGLKSISRICHSKCSWKCLKKRLSYFCFSLSHSKLFLCFNFFMGSANFNKMLELCCIFNLNMTDIWSRSKCSLFLVIYCRVAYCTVPLLIRMSVFNIFSRSHIMQNSLPDVF